VLLRLSVVDLADEQRAPHRLRLCLHLSLSLRRRRVQGVALLLQLRGSRVAAIGAEIEVVDQKPPRSDVLPKMAEALGVSVEDLLIVDAEKAASRKAAKIDGE